MLEASHHYLDTFISNEWGDVQVTPWTAWKGPDGQEFIEHTPCSTAGMRAVSTLTRERRESMHTAFVPSLSYTISTTVAGMGNYTLGLIRNLSEPLPKQWQLSFIKTDAIHSSDELRFLPDIGFHDALLKQSVHFADDTQLPINASWMITTAGRSLCLHPTYGIASTKTMPGENSVVDAPEECVWHFGTIDDDIGFQIASAGNSSQADFDMKARVTHNNNTIHNGSVLSLIGVDLRARYIGESPYLFTQLDKAKLASTAGGFVQHRHPSSAVETLGV